MTWCFWHTNYLNVYEPWDLSSVGFFVLFIVTGILLTWHYFFWLFCPWRSPWKIRHFKEKSFGWLLVTSFCILFCKETCHWLVRWIELTPIQKLFKLFTLLEKFSEGKLNSFLMSTDIVSWVLRIFEFCEGTGKCTGKWSPVN